jgi:hypothetical protein
VQVGVDLHMPMLPLRDGTSGVRAGVDQGSHSGHEVVHVQDPLLEFNLT